MKNQYFGAEDDYKKFGILRLLSGADPSGIAICWMFTEDDDSTDRRYLDYLKQPEKWRDCDPELFDALNEFMQTGIRNVKYAERLFAKPSTYFYTPVLTDDPDDRKSYMEDLAANLEGIWLTFFDPDTGLAPDSVRKGNKDSNRYLFWDEVSTFYRDKQQSILIYQYFPRIDHDKFISDTASRLLSETNAPEILSLSTNRMVFFLIPGPEHREIVKNASDRISRRWDPHINVLKHTAESV